METQQLDSYMPESARDLEGWKLEPSAPSTCKRIRDSRVEIATQKTQNSHFFFSSRIEILFLMAAERYRPVSIEDLPSQLVIEILSSGKLSAIDLLHLELTSRTFGGSHGLYPHKFGSLVDYAAYQLCVSHSVYGKMERNAQRGLFDRCGGKWKRVLRFLQSVEQSSDMVETSAGNMQITTGRYHTLLISNSSLYSCGSSLCGVLGNGPETKQCVTFSRINFPSPAQVVQVSASHNHAAFVMQSGEVFTCGDNSSFCCGHKDTNRPIFRPRLVEALKGLPCKQVATGLNFTVFLTRKGHVYTCGANTHGQLGHGDTIDSPAPKMIELPEGIGYIVQIAAGPSYVLAVADNGVVYSFGSGSHFCLGHGEQHDEFQPRAIQTFKRKGIHVVRVSAGDEHAVALDSSGYVYTWGKGYCGCPELLRIDAIVQSKDNHWCCQNFHRCVLESGRPLFSVTTVQYMVVVGWGLAALDFQTGVSDKILSPRILDSLRAHHVSQISTGLYHTVVCH
ncbi:Regulator of chromosome condensation family protein [Prunus dulcis]|uniref:Regulator of chromosome condensation family protein n=1 Tax=Prunus dulcis TaxID=3755 RepID=A0A4Y1RC54_PRUDU|nr:Regulator of chromosome condensation family protein [Prunus dulcis]